MAGERYPVLRIKRVIMDGVHFRIKGAIGVWAVFAIDEHRGKVNQDHLTWSLYKNLRGDMVVMSKVI